VKVSIKKKYLNDYSKRKCRVTFLLPKGIGKNAKRAQVVGEFNNWTHSATPMKKLKNGTFVATIELPIGREYQFRYLLDNKVWMNDSDADRFVPAPFGDSKNCVLTTYNDTHIEVIKANQLKPRSSTSNVQPLAEAFL
jgi:1,4-alpha-glucan branching enzyme